MKKKIAVLTALIACNVYIRSMTCMITIRKHPMCGKISRAFFISILTVLLPSPPHTLFNAKITITRKNAPEYISKESGIILQGEFWDQQIHSLNNPFPLFNGVHTMTLESYPPKDIFKNIPYDEIQVRVKDIEYYDETSSSYVPMDDFPLTIPVYYHELGTNNDLIISLFDYENAISLTNADYRTY